MVGFIGGSSWFRWSFFRWEEVLLGGSGFFSIFFWFGIRKL